MNNAVVTIIAGAGGVDATDWAQMLMRVIIRYCERKCWEVTEISETPGEQAGLSSVTFNVAGDLAYRMLKTEMGVHRLVRISPFDAEARRQTSFAAIIVTHGITAVPAMPSNIDVKWDHPIRSYIMYPYQQVMDHRTDVKVSDVSGVLDGSIDCFIEAYLAKQAA